MPRSLNDILATIVWRRCTSEPDWKLEAFCVFAADAGWDLDKSTISRMSTGGRYTPAGLLVVLADYFGGERGSQLVFGPLLGAVRSDDEDLSADPTVDLTQVGFRVASLAAELLPALSSRNGAAVLRITSRLRGHLDLVEAWAERADAA